MSNSAKTVLWIGLALIAFSIVANWGSISATLFGSGGIQRQGDTIGNPPTNRNPGHNGKCPPGYVKMADGTCRLHSRLPL